MESNEVTSGLGDLVTQIDDIKEKLTSQEYMNLMTALQTVHQQKEPNLKELYYETREKFYVGPSTNPGAKVRVIACFNKFMYKHCKNPRKYIIRKPPLRKEVEDGIDLTALIDMMTKTFLLSKKLRPKIDEFAQILEEDLEQYDEEYWCNPHIIADIAKKNIKRENEDD